MEKNINWHEITYQSQQNQVPSKRWGHKTVFVEDEIILFGGFSDVTYLNDLWAYCIHTNRWRQILTTGKKPQGKSNFTMHYDNISNQLLIFGGGGPNKKRFNKISLLDWKTKIWTQQSFDDQNSPWERTYHSSEFKYPFIFTFGGEGAANLDFDDLWAFDIQKRVWFEIKASIPNPTNNNKLQKIQGRRFHSTALIDFTFYVISGCRINYSCIPNIYSVDLKPFFDSIKQQKQLQSHVQRKALQWKLHQMSEDSLALIERWGHSSQAYNNKIYIFGGRNKEDYNDLLQFDPVTNKVCKIVANLEEFNCKLPKSRRRHSSLMIGSSMLIFGGFNMEYFNDMQYISLFECRDNLCKQRHLIDEFYEIIELQERTFAHFLEQINKDKPEYNIEIIIQTSKPNQMYVVKSSTESLVKNSDYFKNFLKYHSSSNPERNSITLSLKNIDISLSNFLIFNAFMLKDILVLPKEYKLKRLYELLVCADYFLNKPLFQLIQKVLTLKVINETQNIDDIFNIAANWKMIQLLKICAQKKILNKSYFNSYSKIISLNKRSVRIKQKVIEQMLIQIQFDQIQKGQKKRDKNKVLTFGKNIRQMNLVASQKGLTYQNNKKSRKRSFVQKIMQSFSNFYSNSTTSQQNKQKSSLNSIISYDSDDGQQALSPINEIKITTFKY